MKIIFHKAFYQVYTDDPAAVSGKMEAIVKELGGPFGFIETEPASMNDLERIHGNWHINFVKSNPLIYKVGCLAAGGAITAAEMAFLGQTLLHLSVLRVTMPARIPVGVSVISTTWLLRLKGF